MEPTVHDVLTFHRIDRAAYERLLSLGAGRRPARDAVWRSSCDSSTAAPAPGSTSSPACPLWSATRPPPRCSLPTPAPSSTAPPGFLGRRRRPSSRACATRTTPVASPSRVVLLHLAEGRPAARRRGGPQWRRGARVRRPAARADAAPRGGRWCRRRRGAPGELAVPCYRRLRCDTTSPAEAQDQEEEDDRSLFITFSKGSH
jgi:hypothetical protein